MTFTVFRRHNRETCDSENRYDPRCGCPLHVQFVWKGAPGVFEGKKLTYQSTSLPPNCFALVLSNPFWSRNSYHSCNAASAVMPLVATLPSAKSLRRFSKSLTLDWA